MRIKQKIRRIVMLTLATTLTASDLLLYRF